MEAVVRLGWCVLVASSLLSFVLAAGQPRLELCETEHKTGAAPLYVEMQVNSAAPATRDGSTKEGRRGGGVDVDVWVWMRPADVVEGCCADSERL